MQVYIADCNMLKFGEYKETLSELLVFAGEQIVERTKKNIDKIIVATYAPEEFVGQGNLPVYVASHLGLAGCRAIEVDTTSSAGAAAFHQACIEILSGISERVLVIAGQKMRHLATEKTTEILARVLSPTEFALGSTMVSLAAFVTKVYLDHYHIPYTILSELAVKSHENGSLNPYAHFQKKVTIEDAENSRIISEPLRLYHCAPISDGACAVLVQREETDIEVAGIGSGTDIMEVQSRETITSFRATRIAAKEAYERAGLNRKDIDVVELHDAFTSFELINSEDLGFFGKGESAQAFRKGRTQINGDIPINPSGGLKSRGHPVAASGLAQIIEIYMQLRGECAQRQVNAPKIGLAHSIGGLASNNFVTILKASK